MTKLPIGLYAITDPKLLPGDLLLSGVESALRGGASVIQYRDKHATHIELLRAAQSLRDLCTDHHALLIMNDDLSLCLRVNADGLHLGKSDGDLIEARAKLGEDKILGVTCHNDLQYAQHCYQLGADYCAFGRVFPSKTKPNAAHCNLDVIRQAAKQHYSSVAIGGISTENLQTLLNKQIYSIAVIHGLFAQENIESTAHLFTTQIKTSFEKLAN